MDRRSFLHCSLSGTLAWTGEILSRPGGPQTDERPPPPVHSIIPVVGDGHWIWTEPPPETGYLEPRDYELQIGIHLEGRGPVQRIKATTPVPVQLPEQQIRHVSVQADAGSARIRPLTSEAAQLCFLVPAMGEGDLVSARANMRLTLYKQYAGHAKDDFPVDQPTPPAAFRKQYSYDSPGIQTRTPEVRRLSQWIAGESEHPWDRAEAIYQWVWENITARIGNYTSVARAVRDRVGDCEERAACFVALCRATGIPARLVWVPNHNWAEFFLVDGEGTGHWIPAHTAAYSWFGWTGVHELVIQKGDHILVPEKRQPYRLLVDWAEWQGAKPKIRYSAALRPLPPQPGEDAGPGARVKDARGQWVLQGGHELDAIFRDGLAAGRPYALRTSPPIVK